jgi:hypothetical protein
MGGPSGWDASVRLGNSSTSQTQWSVSAEASGDELGGKEREVDLSLSIRPGSRWALSVRPFHSRSTNAQQYFTTLSGGRAETFDNRYVFAYIDRSTFSAEFRMSFTLKPKLNLDVYAEPFAASGRYYEFGELAAPGSLDRITYGSTGTDLETQPDGSQVVSIGESTFTLENRDFNVTSFNSNVVLRWEWRPGSTLYLVWQQSRDTRETLGTRVGLNDAFHSITEPGTNILLFKTSFWLPAG